MPAVPQRDEDDDGRVGADRYVDASYDAPANAEERVAVWSADDTDDWSYQGRVDPRADERVARAPVLEGLTATGAAVIGLLGTSLGAALDALVSPGLGWIFFAAFLVSSLVVGLRLRGTDSWAAIAVPPLVFVAAAGISAQVAPVHEGGWVQRTSADMAAVVLDHPLIVIIGTALAALAVVYRSLID